MHHKHQALLAFDTNHIKDYVFATGALRDIRGASALLDRVNRQMLPATVENVAPGARIIYARGGGALVVVDVQDADEVRAAVEQLYRRETHSASVASAVVELEQDVSPLTDLHDSFHALTYLLRLAKDQSPEYVCLPAHALLRPCESCTVDYASEQWYGPEGEMQLCESCLLKRQENSRVTAEISAALAVPQMPNGINDTLWSRLITGLKQVDFPLTLDQQRPQDFDALGALSSKDGYFGLVYADGDGMGAELGKLRTLNDFGYFAAKVDQSVYGATIAAINHNLRSVAGRSILSFDVLFLGGDDLVMVTTAQSAIRVALTLVETFTTLAQRDLGKELGMSASVVIAHASYPFSTLLALAESGLRFSKRRAAERRRDGEHISSGLINFVVTSGVTYPDFEEYMDNVLRGRPVGPLAQYALERTLRPYTPGELRIMLRGIEALEQAPWTKVQQLRSACFLDYHSATLESLTALAHWPDDSGRDRVKKVLESFVSTSGIVPDRFPWLRQGSVYRTPFIDIADLLPFVQQ